MATFERIGKAKQKDDSGNIQIRVIRLDPENKYRPFKGNITRSLTVKDATVSEVFAAIEKALFEE